MARGQDGRSPFPVCLFHSLLHAGLSRRYPDGKTVRPTVRHSGVPPSRHERQLTMKKASTTTNAAKRLKISEKTRKAHAKRDRTLDNDSDAPQLSPDYWNNTVIGKYYRPLKNQISFRIDNEVLDWLKSKGQGHLSWINEILRERIARER